MHQRTKLPAKRNPLNSSDEKDPSLDLSSLVDISFLLLVYFIATSTLRPLESDIESFVIPSKQGGLSIEIPDFEIELTPDGSVLGNGESLDPISTGRELPALEQRLVTYRNALELMNDTPSVTIKAADEAKGQRFLDVLNCLATVKIENVTLTGFQELD